MIPKLNETEGIPLKDKVIHEVWCIKSIGFYWMIAERDEDRAFGYANLNDDQMAEWGYISIDELVNNGATRITSFEPTKFEYAQKLLRLAGLNK